MLMLDAKKLTGLNVETTIIGRLNVTVNISRNNK